MSRFPSILSLLLSILLASPLAACGGGGGGQGPDGDPGRGAAPTGVPALVQPSTTSNVVFPGDSFRAEQDPAAADRLAGLIWQQLVSRRVWVSTVSSNSYSFYDCVPAGGAVIAPCFTYDGFSQFNGSVRTYAVGHYMAADGSGPYLAAAVGLENDEGIRILGLMDPTRIAISSQTPGGASFIVEYRGQ